MNRLIKIFETRLAGIICFLFAIANRIIFTSLHSLLGTDTKVQLTYAQNLLAGKGMGVTKYFTNDLNTPVYDTHLFFPPGFSLFIIPFLKLSGGDEFKAVLAFDILAALIFVIAVRILGKKAGVPPALNNILTIIAGCSQYVFFMSWSSTDVISLCFVLFALAEMIDIVYKKENIRLLKILACSVLFCMPFFFRYQYIAIPVLLPFLILLYGFSSKNKNISASGRKLLIGSVSCLVLLFIFNSLIAGNALHVNNTGRGVFFNQIVHWYPFLPASFINLDFAAQLTTRVTGIEYRTAMLCFEIINLFLFSLFLFLLWRYIRINKKSLTVSRYSIFFTGASAITILIVLMLAYLTLTYKELEWGYVKWNFSIDERYFAFIYVFTPVLLFSSIYNHYSFFKKPVVRFLTIIALCCFCTEVLHGVYYNIKIITFHKDLAVVRESDKGYRSFSTIMDEIKKQNPEREVIICSPDQFYLHAASQMGYKAIFDYQNLGKYDLKVLKKSILILPVHTNELIIMKDYLEKKKAKSISTSDGTFFYIEEINPE